MSRNQKELQRLPSSKWDQSTRAICPAPHASSFVDDATRNAFSCPTSQFPPTEPQKFAAAHRIFGASNISKLLQEIPVTNREDAVISMVYEATARLRDPVYGCAGMVAVLQKEVLWLQSELNAALAEAVALRNRLPDAWPVLAHSQTYKFTSDMENENVNSFHFPQLMSESNNDYDKDFDGMLQWLQVLDSCQASGRRPNNLRGYGS